MNMQTIQEPTTVSITPSAQYRLTIRVRMDDTPGVVGQVTSAIGEAGGMVGAIDLVEADSTQKVRDNARGTRHLRNTGVSGATDAPLGAGVRIDTTGLHLPAGAVAARSNSTTSTR